MQFEGGALSINNKINLESTVADNNRFKTKPTKRIKELKNKISEKNQPVNNNQQLGFA